MQVEAEVVSLLQGVVNWLLRTTAGRSVIALAVLFVGWYCSRVAVRMLGRPVAQRFERQSLTRTILRMIRLSIMLVAIAVAAGVMGIGAGNILLSVTVLSAAVGIILAPIVGNYVSGLFVLADQPYEIGDMIEIVDATDTGLRGFIEDITLRYTKVLSEDNTLLVVPNATIRERDVINYSAEDERTRRSLDMTVSYEGDLAEARRIMVRSARAVDGVISGGPTIRIGSARYPARPTCNIVRYADHGILLRLRYWLRTPYYDAPIRSEIQRRIWEELADADVEIPYPHMHHVFDETSGEAHVTNGPRDGAGPDLSDRR
ncbi:mechanosensitive ion channel family protein [Halalkalicoccus ordinarius]|uniref:mechanosensitive ion channel family protein n=1 Tax=Halalkalicoccus ordinarius TaxID=3116651 RepID=UPI00300E8CEE